MILILIFVLLVPLVGLNYSKDLDRTENRILAKLPSILTSDNKLNLILVLSLILTLMIDLVSAIYSSELKILSTLSIK